MTLSIGYFSDQLAYDKISKHPTTLSPIPSYKHTSNDLFIFWHTIENLSYNRKEMTKTTLMNTIIDMEAYYKSQQRLLKKCMDVHDF